ncbi:MAG: site-specific integrase [Chloroflexota bacterium]
MSEKEYAPTAHITETTLLQPTVQAWKYYLRDQGRSKHTVKAFIADLNILESFLAPDKTIGAITTKDLENFTEWLENERDAPCSPKSLARRITSMKSFFRWLNQNAVILVNPAEKLVQRSVTSPLPTVLSDPEIQLALKAADEFQRGDTHDTRPFTLLSLILETGIKKGECLGLNLNHLDLYSPEGPFIFVRYTNPRYRYKERKILVSDKWVDAFREYEIQYQLTNDIFPWSPRLLEYVLEDIGKAAGLDKHISFDMCRWTSALQDLLNGIEGDKIRQKLGISKIQWREVHLKLRKLAQGQGFDLDTSKPDPVS